MKKFAELRDRMTDESKKRVAQKVARAEYLNAAFETGDVPSILDAINVAARSTSRSTSRILEAVHEAMQDLHDAGAIDALTMRRFDAVCLSESEKGNPGGAVLSTAELRRDKPQRQHFADLPRRPVRVILDHVGGGYNVGAMFRLCDALRLEHMTICDAAEINLRKRRLSQAAKGTQHWVPWRQMDSTEDAIAEARQAGCQIAVLELTAGAIAPEDFRPVSPLCLVIGSERAGVTPAVVAEADVVLAIPMHGMANSLNLATAAAIALHEICKHFPIEEQHP